MAKFGAVLKWAILLPVLIVVLLLAVANDAPVTVRLNPFNPEDPVLKADLALYQIAFLLFVAGALVGALITWSGQRKYRSRARHRRDEAEFWQNRAQGYERQQETRPASRVAAFLPRPERG